MASSALQDAYELPDTNNGDSWEACKNALSARLGEIRRSTYLCIEDKSKHLFQQDLAGLDANVRALERQVAELRARLREETEALPKVESLLKACQQQESDLHAIASHLPSHLPSLDGHGNSQQAQQQQQGKQYQDGGLQGGDDVRAGKQRSMGATDTSRSTAAAAGGGGARPRAAPRWCVTESELAGVAAYMRGRLTLDKVNAAVEELASLADANTQLLATARHSGSKMSGADRKRATELLHSVASKDTIKGRPWVLEADLQGVGYANKTGKSILTLLRHLSRLQEVRCNVDGASTTAYVLQHP